jgi:hypothetical protein
MSDLTPFMFWTARSAALLYAVTVGLLLFREGGRERRYRVARAVYTAGCGLIWVHVALAFQVAHGWSHADAVRVTAARTADLTGVQSGFGVYLNYLFLTVWAADAAYWWRVGHRRYLGRPPGVALSVHGFLLFITFNAAVVFVAGTARHVGAGVTLLLAMVLLAAAARRRLGKP